MDTIVACSTAPLSIGAVGIVRLSGDDALSIASKAFASKEITSWENVEARKMYLGTIKTRNFNDKAFCVYYKAPKSFTGEDVVEFQTHGGQSVINGIIRLCVSLGARPALAGEFTKRAFMNGKVTLDEAEGIADLINAGSEAEAMQAYRLMSGELAKGIYAAEERLLVATANLDVALDYPEEVLEDTKQPTLDIITDTLAKLQTLLAASENRKFLRDGITVAIAGLANVGKSSLMNALLKEDMAIVTDVAGTTRDLLRETIEIDGIKINLVDTAGIRETVDKVEKIGIERAKNAIRNADLVLILRDCSVPESDEEEALIKQYAAKKHITVANKGDIANYPRQADITIEANSGKNVDALIERIFKEVDVRNTAGQAILTRERHTFAVKEAINALQSAIDNFQTATVDCTIVDVKAAYSALASITGSNVSESVVDKIFSEFCVGK